MPTTRCRPRCTVILLVLLRLALAQYEHLGYPPGFPNPEQEQYTAPQLAPDTPRIQLRLAGDKRKHNEGRVEVFYNAAWGTVCDDDFNIHAAQVVCRELGYLEAISWSPSSKYGKGEGPIWFDNLRCTGKEKTLAQCPSNGIGVSDCKHSEDVGVVCSDKRIPGFKFVNTILDIQVEDVRIRAILSSYRKRIPVTEGYVEVKDGGKWKQICNTEWTQSSARVICGMFGFPGERKYNARVYKMFARRKRPTYWDYAVNCTGNEAHLSSCKLGQAPSTKSNGTCPEGLPVVVSCVPGRDFAPTPMTGFRKQPLVRLRGGAIVGEGRVEVLKNGEWGTICDDKWNLLSATVVCRELGFGTAKEALSGGRLGQGMGPVHMNEVACSGFEKSVTECFFNKEALGCSHEEDAAVRCNVPAMGFQQSETWYWPGQVSADPVVMSGVRCSGTEMSLSHCLHHGAHLSCAKGGGRNAAGVACSETAPDLVLNPQVVEQTTYMEDRPMFMLHCAYEENCLSSTSSQAPANSYRRLLRFSSQIHNNGHSDFRPKAGRHSWVWHDCHRHYHSMEVFTLYDLVTLNGTKVAEGHKASFCLEDSECDEGIEKRYECANFGEQGITVGCWDTYRHDIDCQWIDITELKPGDYIFQIVINPNYEVPESDYSNNIMKCRCRYDGHRVWMYSCHNGGSLSTETEETFPGLLNNQVTHR
uniref:Lysyl oxidase homolog n=1 Tax=Gasterosteus aculeatus aculeatus TaxID=481459 RepID=A0AAQ4RP87_GASAC